MLTCSDACTATSNNNAQKLHSHMHKALRNTHNNSCWDVHVQQIHNAARKKADCDSAEWKERHEMLLARKRRKSKEQKADARAWAGKLFKMSIV